MTEVAASFRGRGWVGGDGEKRWGAGVSTTVLSNWAGFWLHDLTPNPQQNSPQAILDSSTSKLHTYASSLVQNQSMLDQENYK
jgi:hypothetical protein